MAKIQIKEWIKWGVVIILGVIAAFLLEAVITIYQISRGYGEKTEYFPLAVMESNDYMVGGEDGKLWVTTGADPWVILYSDREIGHIRIRFQEPLTKDMSISCFYGRDNAFHTLQHKERYLLEGTKEAVFTIPYGKWNSYRLGIAGDFFLDKLEGAEVIPLSAIQARQVQQQINQRRLLVFLFIFCASGCLMAKQRERRKEKEKQEKGKQEGTKGKAARPRVLYLDAVRVLAALLVILVHIVGPMELIFSLRGNKVIYWVFWCIRFVIISCNPLFFMLSGALLLPWRDEAWSEFVKKRLIKVVLPLLVYGGIYLVVLCASQASLREWLSAYTMRMLEGRVQMGTHLWMVFELIGMYLLVIPFRAFLNHCSEQTEKMLAVFILALTGIRSIAYVYGIELAVSTFLGDWTGVFLFGYLMNQKWMRRYDRFWAVGGLATIIVGAFLAIHQANSERYIFGSSIFVLVIACGIFSVILHMEDRLQRIKGILVFFSQYSYSILLIHWFVLHNILFIQGLSRFKPMLYVFSALSSCVLLSFLFSVFIDNTIVALIEHGIRQMAYWIGKCLKPGIMYLVARHSKKG